MLDVKKSFLSLTPITEGGEGTIYEYQGDIYKIFKDTVDINKKLAKLQLLFKKRLPKTVVAPRELVSIEKQFAGYTMEKVQGEELKQLSTKKFIKANKVTFKNILKVLTQIKNTLVELHKQNIYIGDLNDANILFTSNFDVYFIDVDSWSIDNIPCDVAMDSFKDPKLHLNHFTADTDAYAFAIMVWKSLTKIHPFGGTTDPDMDLLTRMDKRISVIDRPSVIIPKTIPKWNFIPPTLLQEMKDIFETSKRVLLDNNLDNFYQQLTFCKTHNEYYFNKFKTCPFCDENVKITMNPQKIDSSGTLPLFKYFSDDDIDFIIALDLYIDKQGFITHKASNKKIKKVANNYYYFSNDGLIMFVEETDLFTVYYGNQEYKFEKLYKSHIKINNNICYYIDRNSNLIELKITPRGNSPTKITKCATKNIFECISSTDYLICNIYDNQKIFNISGFNFLLKDKSKIINYGIHFDFVSKQWLVILEDTKGKFKTMVFEKNNLIFETDMIKYTCPLNCVCFNNKTIFIPEDGFIRGFAYNKDAYKDFNCQVVTNDSKLIKNSNKFFILNDKEIYTFG